MADPSPTLDQRVYQIVSATIAGARSVPLTPDVRLRDTLKATEDERDALISALQHAFAITLRQWEVEELATIQDLLVLVASRLKP